MSVLSVFRDDEGGFTTVTVAVALLLSLTLVFAAASAGWVSSRSSEVQRVADASALAGSNSVAAFTTVSQVLDACTLSLGLAGIIVYGAGLVTSCVPGLTGVGVEMCSVGGRILDARGGGARPGAAGGRPAAARGGELGVVRRGQLRGGAGIRGVRPPAAVDVRLGLLGDRD